MIKATDRKKIRLVAKTLIAVMVLPHFLIACTTPAVMAQNAGTNYVAVIDLANDSKMGDSMLSRLATDAVVVELTNSNKFSVVTRQQMETALSDLDLKPPLTLTGVLRIAEKLAVNAVIVGEIREIKITDKPRQARTELVIRMLDASTGEPINGAIARGTSTPRPTFTGDDDVLVTEAINNAAYVGVKRMTDYIIPEATILNAIGSSEVLLNRGAQDGITTGMEMIVSRDNEVIGKIRIKDVSNNDSQAVIVSAVRGVQPQDKARAIFRLPATAGGGYDEPASKVSGGVIGSGKKKSGLGTVAGIALGLLILLALGGSHKTQGETPGSAIAAEAGVAPTLNAPGGAPGVRITLNPSRFPTGGDIQQIKVWRDDQSTPVFATLPSAPSVLDYQLPAPGTRTVTYLEVNPNDTSKTVSTPATVPGVQAGTTYTYSVSVLYRRIASLTGSGTDSTGPTYLYEEGPRQFAGRATPLDRLLRTDLTQPAYNVADVDLNNISFEWKSVLGADSYIVEASLDPSFKTVNFRSSPTGELFLSSQNIAANFPIITTTTTIYWRVGAVNSGDTPGAIPDIYSKQRYMFSETSQFKPKEEPPPPPGS